MLPPAPEPRMAPVQSEEFNEETRAFLGRWTGGFFKEADRNPVLQTFAHHPKLAELFSQFNIHILTTNTMPVKQRQIAIMRTAWITKATYMWSSHLNTSVACGLSDDMFRPIQMGPDDPYFTDFERTIMLATDELVNDRTISDENWKKLMAEWTNQQMLDFMFTVGCYLTSAMVMRATGVQRMPDLLTLAEKYGAPE
jgi:alkylhydroperoxidase family enzyme